MQIRSYFINTYLSSISIRWTSLVVTTMSLNYNPTFGMKPPKRIVKSKVVPANNISGPHLEFQNFKLGYSTPFVKPKTKSSKRCASASIIFIQTLLLSLSLSLSLSLKFIRVFLLVRVYVRRRFQQVNSENLSRVYTK
jgi:hypothetical protein